MIRRLLVLIALLLLTGCPPHTGPNPTPGPTPNSTPYTVARTAIVGAQLALAVADGVFETWAMVQTDADRVASKRGDYVIARTLVADSLKVALAAVAIAEQQQQGVSLAALLAEAEQHWQALRKLLVDVSSVAATGELPAQLRAAKRFTVADLPPTLLPAAP